MRKCCNVRHTSGTHANGTAFGSWDSDFGIARDYQLEGTPTLGAPFGPTNELSRFFRVKVSMPEKH